MIAILASSNDRHAAVVQAAIEARHQIKTCLISNDTLQGNGALHWRPDGRATIPTSRGAVQLDDISTIWNRRPAIPSREPLYPEAPETQAFIDSECAWGLNGALLSFRGRWVSHPTRAIEASNKLRQLACAMSVGLRTPKTIVSQIPKEIRAFADALNGDVIVKEIRGTSTTTATTRFDLNAAYSDETLSLCPAIFQERIHPRMHLRVHSFGKDHYAAAVDSDELDWRFNLNKRITPFELPKAITQMLDSLLWELGLEMGVSDLILTDAGEPVFLEINPQGQFLFIEGLSGLPLSACLAAFLAARVSA